MRRLICCASLAVLLTTVGCGGTPRSRVYGKITYQDKPLVRAAVTLFGSDNMTYITETRADGTYEMAGVPRGPVRVSVALPGPKPKPRPDPVPGQANEVAVAEDRAKGARSPAAPVDLVGQPGGLLPTKYTSPDTSGLAFELTAPDQEFNIDLK